MDGHTRSSLEKCLGPDLTTVIERNIVDLRRMEVNTELVSRFHPLIESHHWKNTMTTEMITLPSLRCPGLYPVHVIDEITGDRKVLLTSLYFDKRVMLGYD